MPGLKARNGCFHANDNLIEVPGVEGVPVLLDLEAGRVEVVADEVHVDLRVIKHFFNYTKITKFPVFILHFLETTLIET